MFSARKIILFLAVAQTALVTAADSPLTGWQAKAMAGIDVLSPSSSAEEVFAIGRYAAIGAETPGIQPERAAVALRARRKLLTDPGYIAHYKIGLERAIQAEFDEARDAASAIRVNPTRGEIYLALAQLPSPQVVGLLGELLYDERDPWKDEPSSDYDRPCPNSIYAIKTLNRIGLDGVQIIELKTTRENEAALHQWKLWYEQVKAGTRTFRFMGDPQEYRLADPVSKAVERVVSSPKSNDASLPSQVTAAAPSKPPVIPLVGAMILLAAAIGFTMKKKRSSAA
jgi:hypothetical protein